MSGPPPAPDAEDLLSRISACRLCADRFAATATAHDPRPVAWISPTARILVAGQAPGARVQESGLPFDDASGDRLRGWMGLGREAFYDRARMAFLPMGFCFPGYDAKGSDLPPPALCARTWRAQAMAAMPRLSLVLLVGGHAQRWHLGGKRSVAETVRDWRANTGKTPALLPMPHPSWRNTAWLRRNPWFEEEVTPWLRARVAEALAEAPA
ncbi:uracil-DNA glycosylase family protein [Rhodovulum sp. DZ06]|uniref:uracil-DNA glycosylase family protein n=1 Tax=Rhodovulum sp. DZ06 TaxID=3425126 RepID=UPI003D32688F